MQNDGFHVNSSDTDRIIAKRYRLQRPLGKGSFGQVFLAQDIKFNPPRIVALKLLNSQFLADPKARQDLEQEAGILARFNHPNILRVIDFEVTPELAYIVTDLAEGGSLAAKLRSPSPSGGNLRLSLREVLQYLEPLCLALDEAHSMGLVHRDIKPLNILLDKYGRPLLADFGLAASLSTSASSILVDTTTSGTPSYMAPEQWSGQAGKASDIYALGVVAFQLITGQTPYTGNQAALAWQHLNAPIPRLSERAPDLSYPPDLDRVLAAVLAKDPHQRLRPASAFAQQFRAVLDEADNAQKAQPQPEGQGATLADNTNSSTQFYTPPTPIVNMQPQTVPAGKAFANQPEYPSVHPINPVSLPASDSQGNRRFMGQKPGLLIAVGLIIIAGIAGGLVLLLGLANSGGKSPATSSNSGLPVVGTNTALPSSSTSASSTPGLTAVAGGQGQLNLQVIEAEGGATAQGDQIQLAVYKQGDRNKAVANANYSDKADLPLPPGTYEVVVKYTNNIEVTSAPIEVKAGQTSNQTINLHVGQAQVQVVEAEGHSARDNDVVLTVYKKGDRNKVITTANYSSKATMILRPDTYEIVAKYANTIEVSTPPFEIKEGQSVTQTINLHVGQVQIQVVEVEGGRSARDDDVQLTIYKKGDRNTKIATANYSSKADITLQPGTYEVEAKYANSVQVFSPAFEIKEGQSIAQPITLHVGRVQLEVVEATGKTARDDDVTITIYKQGDHNTAITTANYSSKAEIVLQPGIYEVEVKYANGIVLLNTVPLEVKEGQDVKQTINLHVGRVSVQVVEASGKAAQDSEVLLSVYKQGDRNTEITNANYVNKADIVLRPGSYEIVVQYNNGAKVTGPAFEIKEGQTVNQTLKV